MAQSSAPNVSVALGINPSMHSFSDSEVPSLQLTVTSHHSNPITIYADDLSPKLMLTGGAFVITDLTNGTEVKQSVRTHCRIPPPTKVSVPLIESLFHTLLPDTPLTISTPFTRARSNGVPLPKYHTNYEEGIPARSGACGVDGLEAGHRYALSLSGSHRVPWDSIRWWEYGTKEQVLSGEDGVGLDGRTVRYGHGPHETIKLDISGIHALVFECKD